MALHPDFPRSPYEVLSPAVRWIPAPEEVPTLIGGNDFVRNRMGQGCFRDLKRGVGAFRHPGPERRPETMRHGGNPDPT